MTLTLRPVRRSRLAFRRSARALGSAAVVALLCLLAAPPLLAGDLFEELDPSFLANSYWYEGLAEINLYDAQVVIYGQPRQAEELAHVLVTEDHRPDLLVKADDPNRADKVGMLKLNYTTDARTGVYTYRQMLSFFFDRSDWSVAKMTLAHHEWCGNTFKELVNFRNRSSYEFNTYWDGQGNGSFEVDFPEKLVIYDSLPVQLRGLRFREGLKASFELLPRQLSSRAVKPRWSEATLSVGARSEVSVPAGKFTAWPIELRHGGGVDSLWFEADFPHRLLRWQRADGDTFALRTSEKLPYWNHGRLQDEDLLGP